jgi:curved DNA-binding protein CbpA
MNYYVVLGIAEDADEDSIRSAFRALARRYHPDVGAGSSAVEFQRAREAYETLVDPDRRRRYDRLLQSSRSHPIPVREVFVSAPFAVPLVNSRRPSFGRRTTFVTVPRRSSFDELVEEFFASFDDYWFGPRRGW